MKFKIILINTLFAVSLTASVKAIEVNTTSDSDGTNDCSVTCTLRDAINHVEEGGAITFGVDGSFYIDPAYGSLLVSDKAFTIQGNGQTLTIIDGGDDITSPVSNVSIFTIDSNSEINFKNLTIQNGNSSTGGGGIKANYAYLNFENVKIANNTAKYGGGLYAEYSEIVLLNSIIANNEAIESGSGGPSVNADGPESLGSGKAGGIGVELSKITITNSTISQNKARLYAGAGIFSSQLELTFSTISENESTGGYGAIKVDYSDSTIDDCVIENNTSLGLNIEGGTAIITNTYIAGNSETNTSGGGINIADAVVEISDSTIYNNTAESGGGIFFDGAASANLINVTVSSNTSEENGGGVYMGDENIEVVFSYCTIAFNIAGGYGGGFYGERGNVTTEWTIFSDNTGSYSIGDECTSYGTVFLESGGYNFVPAIGSESCAFESTTTDITEGNADLQPLADNGGPVPTHALGDSSDLNDIAACDEVGDGRNLKRDTLCDIGAFEYGATEEVTEETGGSSGTPTSGTPSDTDPASGTGVGGGDPSGESMFESGSPTAGGGGCSLFLE